MTRAIPQIAVDFVASHEGLKLTAYPDPATGGDPWTIGYGSTGPNIKRGLVINRTTALAYLRSDMQIAVRKLYGVLKPDVIEGLTEHEWAALLSFAFNVGCGAKWGIWKHINAGRLELVPGEIMKFTRANGKIIKGLVNRRADEVKLWSTVEPHEAAQEHEPPPSAVTRQPGMTPPVTDAKPLAKQGTFLAQCGAGASVGLATVSQFAEPTKKAAAQLSAFTGAPIIEHLTTTLLTVAGLCVTAGLVAAWLKHRSQ